MYYKKNIFLYIYIIFQFIRILFFKFKNKNKYKVLILGLSRTGTSSICDYLSQLNYRTWHFTKHHNLISFLGYNAMGDLAYFRRKFTKLDIKDDTKYILTIRDPEKWKKSMIKFAYIAWNIKKDEKQPFFSKTFIKGDLFTTGPINIINNNIHNFITEYPEFYSNDFKYVIREHQKYIENIFNKNEKKEQLLIIDVTHDDKNKIKKQINDFLNIPLTDKMKFNNIKYSNIYKKQLRKLLLFF